MSPAVHDALNQFIIQFLSFAGVLATVGGLLLKAYVDRRIKRKDKADDQALEEREQTRQLELEQMRQKTAELQQKVFDAEMKAEQSQAIGENLTNLTSAVLKFAETHANEQFANREMLSNHIQTIGDLSQSVDRVGTILEGNTAVSKAATKVVSDLFDRYTKVFPTDKPMETMIDDLKQAIIDALEKACEEKKQLPKLESVTPPTEGSEAA